MRIYNLLAVFILSLTLLACGNGKDLSKSFKLTLNKAENSLKNGDQVSISLKSKGEIPIDSVIYKLDGAVLGTKTDLSPLEIAFDVTKLGAKNLSAQVYAEGKQATLNSKLTFLASETPTLYTYEIVNTYPHDKSSYTQGLEFHDNILYESVGEYGESGLLKTELETGKILERKDLEKKYFAEGLTVINNQLVQLTWRENVGFVYDLNSFEKTDTFNYGKSKEGWGLCNDGQVIYKSDGTEKIWLLDPETFAEQEYIQVVDSKKLRSKYNELEWVDGKIYANSYQFDSISIINPTTGAIEGVVDLRPLKKEISSITDGDNEVLNGIAYNAATKQLYVTGKHWDKLFEIRLIKK